MTAPPPRSTQGSDRLLGLDSLRGLAALGVVLYHYTSNYDFYWGHSQTFPWRFGYGALGVQIFFVISGFVILMSLERASSVTDFAFKRFCRLYPPYWAAIAITFTVVTLVGLPGREVSLSTAIVNLTMFQRAFGLANVDGPYWTLYVELCFYILMGCIFAFRLDHRLLPILFCFAIAGTLNAEYGWFSEWKGVWRLERVWPLRSHLSFFIFGILLYRIRSAGFSRALIAWLAGCLILMGIHTGFLTAATIALVTGVVSLRDVPILQNRVLLYLGTISYSLYLIHAGVGYVIIRSTYSWGFSGQTGVALALLVALTLGTIIAFAIEKPSNIALRRVWAQSKRENSSLKAMPTTHES